MPRGTRAGLRCAFAIDDSGTMQSARLMSLCQSASVRTLRPTGIAGLEPEVFASFDRSLARQIGVALRDPVARRSGQTVDRIVHRHAAVVTCFLQRLSADRPAIEREFAVSNWEHAQVVPVHASDEGAGISAVALMFAHGERITYEPRAMHAMPLLRMLDFLSRHMSEVRLRGPHTLQRIPYAWCGHPPRDDRASKSSDHVTRSAGALMAAALLLHRRIDPRDVVMWGDGLIVTRSSGLDRRMAVATRGDLVEELASTRAGFGESILHVGVLTREFIGGGPVATTTGSYAPTREAATRSAISTSLADVLLSPREIEGVAGAFREACAIVAQASEGTPFERGVLRARRLMRDVSKMSDHTSAVRAGLHFNMGIVGPALVATRSHGGAPPEVVTETRSWRDADFWFAQAELIAAGIRDSAIRRGRSELTWLSVAPPGACKRRRVAPMGLRLCDGQAGLALLFATLATRAQKAPYEQTARAALAPIRRALRDWCSAPNTSSVDVGGWTGLGSIIYTLARCAVWLDDPLLTADAKRIAERITRESIHQAVDIDVMGGAAGLLLALLALNAVERSDLAMERAITCGERLLAECQRSEQRWTMRAARPVATGFGHGIAGIAAALARLARVTGDARYLDAARRAIAAERMQFAADGGVWLDPRVGDAAVVYHGWCTGAPGIALGRLSVLRDADDVGLMPEIEHAIGVTSTVATGTRHHLCCGTMSIVEADLVAADVLNRPALRARASTRAAEAMCAVREQMTQGRGQAGGIFHSGMLEGMAGIAFQCLRLAASDAVPCALLFD